MNEQDPEQPFEIEINGELDLHAFHPREIIDVLASYIEVCVEKRIPSIRIIHGKGIGVQRDRVQSFLKNCPHVSSYGTDSYGGSGWGATIARLKIVK